MLAGLILTLVGIAFVAALLIFGAPKPEVRQPRAWQSAARRNGGWR